jgi:hypothetical protein
MDPSSGPDPGAQTRGDSVIRSGESPVIGNTGATNISIGMGVDGVGSLTMDDFGLFFAN